jgi:hypothetical protein
MSEEQSYQHLYGWRGVDDLQRSFASQFPTLAQSAPDLVGGLASTEPVLLFKAWRDVLGKDPAYPAQQIGDCVSFGHGHGNDLLQCIEIGLGAPVVYQETDTEFIYGTSREVAGILGRQDGSYGAAAVKAMTTVGMVSRAMLGSDGSYSGQRAKAWGLSGASASIKQEAGAFKLGSAAQVSTWDELVAALRNGYPVTICTAQGFNLERDTDGFCRARGRWGHCMFIAGVRFDRPGACIIQSWGPDTPSGPRALDQPSFSFWADRSVVERILGEGDSWALSKSPAFEKRELPPAWKYHDAA